MEAIDSKGYSTTKFDIIKSDKVNEICRNHWKSRPDGSVHPTCCHGCPISRPCGTWYPTTYAGVNEWIDKMNQAAEASK